ncbi:hypothetical protein JKF63_00371 [Porcisia hertigi]|uniref:Uncharacterized protein n=1 Tax=Porcisia hertigi TaxID=2761500 RepID=A0A836KY99_9TRYP|nr:hypothetical protein JKF63_00371 [Porcisia hertigi]
MSVDIEINCNHGTWNAHTNTCDCEPGWSNDWLFQDALSGKAAFCNSLGSLPPDLSIKYKATRTVPDRTIVLIIFSLSGGLILLSLLFLYCCYKHKWLCLKKEERCAKHSTSPAAQEQVRFEGQLRLYQMQDEAARQQLRAAQLEMELRNQVMMNRIMSMSSMAAAPRYQVPEPSRYQPWNRPEVLPHQPCEEPRRCDVNYGGNVLANNLSPPVSQEPFAQRLE